MGFRQGAVLSATSFFLGVLFIAFNVDRRILYNSAPPTELDYADAVKFYKTFYEAPLAIKGLLHAVLGSGLLACVFKVAEWDESALFFDGTSLGLYLIGIILYISVTLPTMRSVISPQPQDTIADQREALSVLIAGNTLIILCLVGILFLQGGQEYARRQELKEAKAFEEAALAAAAAEKKDK